MIIGPSEGINRLKELDVNVSGVVVTKILLDEADQVGIVGPVGVLVQPERDLGISGPGAGHNELDPVLDGDVLDLTHPPDVASLRSVLVDLVAGSIGDSDGTLRGNLKSLKVYGCVVKLTFLLVVLIGVVNIIVGPVGDETLDLLELLVLVPHLNTVDVEHEGVKWREGGKSGNKLFMKVVIYQRYVLENFYQLQLIVQKTLHKVQT